MPADVSPPLRLPWWGALLTLVTAGALLLGPLWDDAAGENPLHRAPGPDWQAIQRLGLPTVMVLASVAVALALPRRPLVGALALGVFGYAVLRAPDPLQLWFLPALLVTAAAYVVGVVAAWRRRPGIAAQV